MQVFPSFGTQGSLRQMPDVDLQVNAPEPDMKAALNTALSRLPAEQREAIELAVGARMNYLQIAEHTGAQGTKVQRDINRGLIALRVALRDYPSVDSFNYPESDRS